jgi:hypothetical protein
MMSRIKNPSSCEELGIFVALIFIINFTSLEFMNIAIKPSPIGEGRVRSYKKYIHKLY